jgi:signal transduction histidine kinase
MADADIAALIKTAWQQRDTEQWDRMLDIANELREVAEQKGERTGVAQALAIRAFVFYIRSEFETALGECIEALRLSAGDPDPESRARGVLAMVHWTLGNYEEALRNTDQAIAALEQVDEPASKAFAFAVKGGILLSLGQLDEALGWHQRSILAFQTVKGEEVGRARSLAGLGLTYLAQKQYEDALPPLFQALEIARRAGNAITTARTLNDLGEAFEALENDEQALLYHQEALDIRKRNSYEQSETTSLLAVGRIHLRHGKHEKAIPLLRRALGISEQLGMRPRIAQCHHALANAFQQTGQLAPALEHFLAWEKIKSEIAADQAALRYKAIAYEAQIEAIHRQAELEGLASLGALVAAIAHEVNSPLGAIQSSANVALLAAEKLRAGGDGKTIDVLVSNAQVITEATRRISNLVGRLKVLAGVDQSHHGRVDLVRAIEDTVALLRPEFEDRVEVRIHPEASPSVYGYPTDLHQMFLGLLRNAVQAIDGAGTVDVRITSGEEWIRIAFVDSGRGIPAETIRNLFTPGFAAGSGRVRASLGLFTCMATAKKHGGDIRVASEPGQGSTFTVLLPRSLENAVTPPDAL